MIHQNMLHYSIQGKTILPCYLRENDHPWLRVLIELYESYSGRRRRELNERLKDPFPMDAPSAKQRIAIHVLDRLSRDRCRSRVSPRKARAEVFGAAARGGDADEIIAKVAISIGVDPDELRESLFADLPDEKRVAAPSSPLSPSELALRSNLALVQSMICRAVHVCIEIEGNSRVIVRHAKRRGLLCTLVRRRSGDSSVLEISGPFAIFKRTVLYGRALSGLVPLLAWCNRFKLTAGCVIGDRQLVLLIRSGDPIFPASEPRRFDSRLEERFARDFMRRAPEWELIREPEPVEACGTLIFPDFLLRRRHDIQKRWFLEIVGFWTPDYISKKLRSLKAAALSNLILCIDEERKCSAEDLPPGTPVIRFRRRIDAREVLRIIQEGWARS